MLSESNNFNKTFQNFPILRICVHNLKFAGPLSVKNFILPVEMELCIEMQAVACIFLHHHRSYLENTDCRHPIKLFFIEIQNFWAWADR